MTLLIEDPAACGMGEGARCCAFLTMGGEGFMCGRTMIGLPEAVRARLAAGTMNAKYDPGDPEDVPFPLCQEQRTRSVTQRKEP